MYDKHVHGLGKTCIYFQPCGTAELTVAACAFPRWPSCPHGIHLYTLSWLHSPFPSSSLSPTLEQQTGAREKGEGLLLNGKGASLRYFVLSPCLKLLSQVLVGSPFKMISDCVAQGRGIQNAPEQVCSHDSSVLSPWYLSDGSTWMKSLSVICVLKKSWMTDNCCKISGICMSYF